MNLKLVAAARTFLFNFGRGDISPFSVYRQTCKVLGEEDLRLAPIPTYKLLYLGYSFFSKEATQIDREPAMILYNPWEHTDFCSQASAVKLNWLRNFTYMQELLFNFSIPDLNSIRWILDNWKRSNYEPCRLPFATSSSPSKSILQFAE